MVAKSFKPYRRAIIFPANGCRIFLATAPVDFRKEMYGIAAHLTNQFDLEPYSGAFSVFRSNSEGKIKVWMWDATGLVLIHKRLNGQKLVWPSISGGTQNLSKTQF